MAIAIDVSTGSNGSGVSSLTYAHTCTGANLVLFVSSFTTGGDLCTGVTYGGVALTKIGASVQLPDKSEYIQLWYLIAPATGANNVVLTYSASSTVRSNSASYTGAKQSGVPDANTSNTNTVSTTILTSLTSIADNCWHILTGYTDGGSQVAGTGSTQRNLQANALGFYDSNSAKTPAGSVSMTIDCASGTNATIMASFAPVAALGPANLKSYNTNLKANIKSMNTNLIANVKSFDTNV